MFAVHAEDYAILHIQNKSSKVSDGSSSETTPTFVCTIATHLPTQFINDFTPSGLSCWQIRSDHDPQETNLHIVVSTGSGTKLAAAFYKSALQPLWTHMGLLEGRDYAVHYTESEDTITQLTQLTFLPKANEGTKQAIVLLSGDGGILDIVNVLLNSNRKRRYSKPNVALLPFGTGNALAHSLRISEDETMGIATMVRGHHQPLPLMRISFSPGARLLVNEARETRELPKLGDRSVTWGAVVCSWGMHASLVADSDTTEYRKHGAERFKMAANEALYPKDGSLPHEYQGRISILRPDRQGKWEDIERSRHAYVLATLVSNLEKGFTISPESKPLDGKLRLVHFGPMPGDGIMKIMTAAYQGGTHVEDNGVAYEEIEAMKITFEDEQDDGRWRRVCVDGKIIMVEKGGWVTVQKEPQDVVDIVCMSPSTSSPSGSTHGSIYHSSAS